MRLLSRMVSFWRTLFRSSQLERDLDDELQSFVEVRAAHYAQTGSSTEAARRQALLDLGGVEQVKEGVRDARTGAWLDTCWRDIRYAVRMLFRAPGFAAVVIVTVALTIGASTTVFSVIRGVIWQELPYPAADRLVLVGADARGLTGASLSGAEALDLRAESMLFDGLASIVRVDAHVTVDDEMEHVAAASVTDEALALLGTPLAQGRLFDASRDFASDGFVRSVIISHELWQRRLSGDPRAIGRHIEVNNLDVEVVGILRPEFRVYLPADTALPEVIDIWFPRPFEDDRRSRGTRLGTLARLVDDLTPEQAQARLDAISQRLLLDHAGDYSDGALRLFVKPLHEELTADVRPAMWALAGAVAFVLLIGCVNVGNLMLARARARATEMAVRHALGGTQARLIGQVFTETAVVALVGGAAGLLVTYAGIAVLDWLRPTHLPRQSAIRMDGTVVAFTAAVSIGVAILCSLLPVLAQRLGRSSEVLRLGRAEVQRPGARRIQRVLVIAEVALCIVPLVAGGLMLHTFVKLSHAPIGFRPEGVLTAKLAYSFLEFSTRDQRLQLLRDAIDRVRELPGVHAVSIGGPLPFDHQFTRTYGADGGNGTLTSIATVQSILPGYLAITGVQLAAGRDFTNDDVAANRRVVIVDERIAQQLWPQGAVGQRLVIGQGRPPAVFEVIGVTNAVRAISVRDAVTPHLFVPYDQFGLVMSLVVDTDASTAAIGPAMKHAIESLGTRRPVYDIQPMRMYFDRSVADTQFTMLVIVAFAATALLLAAIGIYGTLSYLAAQRRQEFALRMALGASARQILAGVMGEGLLLTGLGAAAGLVGAIATGSLLETLLYEVTPVHRPTLLAVSALVAVIAVVATAHPAWRAARIDPATALRAE